jgi:hypothetical protein
MQAGEGIRVFDRESWRRKARVPEWLRREENEKQALLLENPKAMEKW